MIRHFSIWAIASSLALAAAPAPEPLIRLLDRTGARVDQFWQDFASVSCLETVTQVKLEPSGKVLTRKQATFDYVILIQVSDADVTVDESRMQQGKPPKASERALLATSGFSTLALILHPHFQDSFQFAELQDGNQPGRPVRHVRFEHIRGRRSPSVLQLRGREYPIEWRGEAWIDAATGAIARIHAELKAPMADVGMQKLSSDVSYSPVGLKGAAEAPWLPERATIEAATERQRWQNVHLFSRYRQFSVDTEVHTEAPKQ